MSKFTLSSGNKIPNIAFGLGTAWYKGPGGPPRDLSFGKTITDAVVQAVDAGFTHIDTAEMYGNYPELAEALQQLDRSKLYITDKFFPEIRNPSHRPYTVLKESLKTLGLEYVDLYLLHLPFFTKENGFTVEEAWEDLQKLQKEGLAKDIGVSNFSIEDLKKIDPPPAVNQIEFSPYLQEQTPGIVEYSQNRGILVEGYSVLAPLSNPGPLDDFLTQLSKKYSRSEADILLRWTWHKNILPVTTTSKPERLTAFLSIEQFKLTDEEVDHISELGKQKRVMIWNSQYYS